MRRKKPAAQVAAGMRVCRRGSGVFAPWLLAGAAALWIAARRLPGFAQWYATRVYPRPARLLGRLSALAPFSLMECVCTAALLAVLPLLGLWVRRLVRAARADGARALARRLGDAAKRVSAAAAAAALAFVLLAGINYQRDPLGMAAALPVQPSSTAQLQTLCARLAAQANALAPQQVRGADGVADATPQGFTAAARAVNDAYAAAARRWPMLGSVFGRAKPMAGSFAMSRLQLTGVFFPFTLEANVNAQAPSFNLPYSIAHELAHLRGFMREDEANFIAYVVCAGSADAALRYSGTLLALIHAGNALARSDPAAYAALCAGYSPQVQADLADNNAFWHRYDDEPLSRMSEQMNDTYLRANGQSEGTRSYGRMVDLLLALQRAGWQPPRPLCAVSAAPAKAARGA